MKKFILILFLTITFTLEGCNFTKDTAITITGSIEGNSTNISTEITSKVISVAKSESDLVKAGDLVYVLDSKTLSIQKQQIRNQMKALETQVRIAMDATNNNSLSLIKYNIKSTEKSLEVINKEIEDLNTEPTEYNGGAKNDGKVPSGTNVGTISGGAGVGASADSSATNLILNAITEKTKTSNLVKLKLQREQITNQLDALKLQLKNTTTLGNNNIKLAKYNLEAAKKSLELVNESIKKCSVYAPINGVITNINFKNGELVAAGSQLFTVMDTSYLFLKVFVPERLLSQVKLGNSLSILNPAAPNKKYSAKIIKIDDQGQFTPRNTETVDEKSNVVFGVKLQIKGDDELKPGMIAEVILNE